MNADETTRVHLARNGDQQAFVQLVTANKDRVWAVCLRTTGNPHDAEDALQDTLTAAWRNITKFRGDAAFSTWLYRIAANAALAVAQRRSLVAEQLGESVSPLPEPGDRVANADLVQAALAQLPVVFRVALVLRVYGDLTYEEIAEHQGIPVQTVKSRLNRARRMLSESLEVQQLSA